MLCSRPYNHSRVAPFAAETFIMKQQDGFALTDYDETHLAVATTYTALGCKLTSVSTKLVFFGTTYCF